MSVEGKIHVALSWDGRAIRSAQVASRRPLEAVRLVHGKPGQQAVDTIPLLFGICGRAQGVAATLALAAAQNLAVTPDNFRRYERQVIGEAIQETAWRFLIDLPKLHGMGGAAPTLVELRQRFLGAPPDDETWRALGVYLEDFLSRHLLGTSCRTWGEMTTISQLESWLNHAATPTARLMKALWDGAGRWGDAGVSLLPDFSRTQMLDELLPVLDGTPDFANRPIYRQHPHETGALARMRNHPLLAELLAGQGATIVVRLLARLLELAASAQRLCSGTLAPSAWIAHAATGEARGVAWVQTARGLLMHTLKLADGLVSDYRIVAPTEWNFHPEGAFARGLLGKSAASATEARRHAELLLLAVDPCVGYKIEVNCA